MEMKRKRKRELIPPWNMPSDPVKAVFWFMQWLLTVLVRFFWIPIIGMMVYETAVNSKVGGVAYGLVSGVITCLVGLGVWGVLYLLLMMSRVGSAVSRTMDDVNRMQQTFTQRGRSSFSPFGEPEESSERVVEGTITDLEEERRKRRREL
jgi:hypothetical protein